MIIQWLGHSCFKLEESTGTTIVTDPYHDEIGYAMQSVKADAVTVSHNHGDHNFVENVTGHPKVIDSIGAFEVDGVHIYSVFSYHDECKGKKRGSNLVFKYRLDGVEICHLGDIGHELTPKLLEAIGSVNVLLIPVGGTFTIDAETAYDYVDKIMPDIVIPMHYKTEECSYNIDDVDEFLKYFDDDQIEYVDGDSLDLDRTHFDGDYNTRVIVFRK